MVTGAAEVISSMACVQASSVLIRKSLASGVTQKAEYKDLREFCHYRRCPKFNKRKNIKQLFFSLGRLKPLPAKITQFKCALNL